jgi:hypothetical protein
LRINGGEKPLEMVLYWEIQTWSAQRLKLLGYSSDSSSVGVGDMRRKKKAHQFLSALQSTIRSYLPCESRN